MKTITTYLLFDGTCQAAMEFYCSCLGGELTLTHVSESAMKAQLPPRLQDKVLNARLKGDNVDISASDWMRADLAPAPGNTVCLYVRGESHADIADLFSKLSPGADVTDPLKEMWFGSYGALNDRFGVRWMFHTDSPRT